MHKSIARIPFQLSVGVIPKTPSDFVRSLFESFSKLLCFHSFVFNQKMENSFLSPWAESRSFSPFFPLPASQPGLGLPNPRGPISPSHLSLAQPHERPSLAFSPAHLPRPNKRARPSWPAPYSFLASAQQATHGPARLLTATSQPSSLPYPKPRAPRFRLSRRRRNARTRASTRACPSPLDARPAIHATRPAHGTDVEDGRPSPEP